MSKKEDMMWHIKNYKKGEKMKKEDAKKRLIVLLKNSSNGHISPKMVSDTLGCSCNDAIQYMEANLTIFTPIKRFIWNNKFRRQFKK